MEKTEALLLRPRETLVRRLESAAEEYGYSSHNQVAVEVLERYLDFWIEIKEAERAAHESQRATALGKSGAGTPSAPSTAIHAPRRRAGGR